jgi:glyoxylase-like metal-dependent hydrolase (beta-lactamase superfamily II)
MNAAWTDLGDGVRVRQSRRYAMNSVALLDPEHAVLVDPGILPSELDDMAAVVAAVAPRAVTLIFSHHHWDHVLGRTWWPAADTLGHDGFAAALDADAAHAADEANRVATEAGERWPRAYRPFEPDHAVSGLHFRRIDPWRLVLRSAPGHCPTQLNVHLPDRGILIAGDMLSDIEIPGLDAEPGVYRASLEALMPMVDGGAIEVIVPGHGALARGQDAVRERFRADLDYLTVIERAARDARARGLDAEAFAASLAGMEYAGKTNPEYPTAKLHHRNVLLAYQVAAASHGNGTVPRNR